MNCSKVNPELPRRRLVVFRPIDSEPFSSVSSLLIIDSQPSLLSDDKTWDIVLMTKIYLHAASASPKYFKLVTLCLSDRA